MSGDSCKNCMTFRLGECLGKGLCEYYKPAPSYDEDVQKNWPKEFYHRRAQQRREGDPATRYAQEKPKEPRRSKAYKEAAESYKPSSVVKVLNTYDRLHNNKAYKKATQSTSIPKNTKQRSSSKRNSSKGSGNYSRSYTNKSYSPPVPEPFQEQLQMSLFMPPPTPKTNPSVKGESKGDSLKAINSSNDHSETNALRDLMSKFFHVAIERPTTVKELLETYDGELILWVSFSGDSSKGYHSHCLLQYKDAVGREDTKKTEATIERAMLEGVNLAASHIKKPCKVFVITDRTIFKKNGEKGMDYFWIRDTVTTFNSKGSTVVEVVVRNQNDMIKQQVEKPMCL